MTLARAPRADEVELVELQLPHGATVADALAAAGWTVDAPGWAVGVWGRVRALDHPLRDGDRVELTRELLVDPKEARRLRYAGQRAGVRRTRSR